MDIYRRWDGYDTSRDLTAFYMRDGGVADDKVYFRVDFEDLQANAEQGALDLYVMIDFNSPGIGEAFTLLTVPPGPDIEPYHNRQIALLSPPQWRG